MEERAPQAPTRPDFITKRPVDFIRDARGTPWVDHPTERIKTGRPRRVKRPRISSYTGRVDDHTLIVAHEERHLLLGATRLPALDQAALHDFDPEASGTAARLDAAVWVVLEQSGLMYKARRGSWVHSVLECVDRGEPVAVDLLDQTEAFGFDEYFLTRLVREWRATLDRFGLEVVAVEHPCVVDEFGGAAGSFDRMVLLHETLTFGDHVVPAGSVLVLDLKTSALRLADGHPSHWSTYAGQVALYAMSRPYFVGTGSRRDRRGEWPWAIDQEHGLIAHVGLEPHEGRVGAVHLWHTDLRAGREAVELAHACRVFTARRDLFTLEPS